MTGAKQPNSESGTLSLLRKVQEFKINKVFDAFRSAKIEPILFKGWAAARYYPAENQRPLGDIDLSVSSHDFASSRRLIKGKEFEGFPVDLHDEFRHLDRVAWDDIFANSELIQTEFGSIRIPRAEDHLRMLCVHWLNDGGAYRDRLWDIYYLITNTARSFDWSRCLDVVSPRRRRWIICTIGLTHRYLDLDLDGLPIRREAEQIPDWVIKCVEREWRRGGPRLPILSGLGDRKLLLDQIGRRLPPNPLRAVIEGEGDIDRRFQFDYQIRVLLRRALPFLGDAKEMLDRRLSKSWGNPSNQD